MITLNEIAYNIKNITYGGSNTTENTIPLRQIKHWIHYHRAKLIADNIDKGITNDQSLFQPMAITARNSTIGAIRDFYADWDAYDINSSLPEPVISGEMLLNMPKTGSGKKLNGEWLSVSSLTGDNDGNQQGWYDGQSRSFYGDEIVSSQVRGDFRNFGSHSFWTPRPLQLKNDQGIKDVSLERYVYFADDPGTDNNEQSGSYARKNIKLYRKEYNNFDDYNKFTDKRQPYYIQTTSRIDRDDGYGHHNYISFRNLQVSPNYHGGLSTPGDKKIFWKYRATSRMILENPTEIDMMYGWWWETETKWDDSSTPYPIPLEYVSDLIQRVLQLEVQAELKTIPDIITDGVDDLIKKKMGGGSHVQK